MKLFALLLLFFSLFQLSYATGLLTTVPSNFSGLSVLSFETSYRLNLGGALVSGQKDLLGRTWQNDAKFLLVNTSVVNLSVIAYATAQTLGNSNVSDGNLNITWVLPIDSSFSYLIRVHFCDILSKTLNEFVFSLFINSEFTLSCRVLSNKAGDLDVPVYMDFVLKTNSNILTVSVVPSANSNKVILNGLEVWNISNAASSFDGNSSVDGFLSKNHSKKYSKKIKIAIIVGSVGSGLAALGLGFLCYWFLPTRISQIIKKKSTATQQSGTATCFSLAPLNVGCRIFSFQELKDATNEFDERLLLGLGGFGRVYKGTIEDGMIVAIKRRNPMSEQGVDEFRTEIEILSKFRHQHLVSLIGYCDEQSEMLIVYVYLAKGTLRDHLYGRDLPSLSWKQRLQICIGSAKGINFLHAESVIHRDIKTANLLLDENFVAKVADFGIAKAVSDTDTDVKGSIGYLDPEYLGSGQLTEKLDVYSFGVVLIEVLCARAVLNQALPREQVNIVKWAMDWQKRGTLDRIMDQNLVGKVNIASLKQYGDTAKKCLAECGDDRPSMGDVLWNLEYALQLEETSTALMETDESDDNSIKEVGATSTEVGSTSSAFGNI